MFSDCGFCLYAQDRHDLIYLWVFTMHQRLLTSTKLHDKNSSCMYSSHVSDYSQVLLGVYSLCYSHPACKFPLKHIETHEWNCNLAMSCTVCGMNLRQGIASNYMAYIQLVTATTTVCMFYDMQIQSCKVLQSKPLYICLDKR